MLARLRSGIRSGTLAPFGACIAAAALVGMLGCSQPKTNEGAVSGAAPPADDMSPEVVAEGKRIFRFETFGNEPFWTDTLHLNEVVQTAVDPTTALKVGLKVDADVLPPGILEKVDLKSPAITVALLK
jgi:hypothetical protein